MTIRADQIDLGTGLDAAARSLRLSTPGTGLSGGLGTTYSVNQSTAFNFTGFHGTLDADLAAGGFKITGLGAPTADGDAATKLYVDGLVQGLDVKDSVRAATTSFLPAYTHSAGVLTADANGIIPAQDGVTLVNGNSILLKDEFAGDLPFNGIYDVTDIGTAGTPYILTRRDDANTDAEVTAGMFTFVSEGTANADTGWVLTTNDPITLGTTGLNFSQFSSAGDVTAGNGLTQSGSVISFVATDTSLTVGTNDVGVNLRASSGLQIATGLGILLDTNPGLALGASGLIVDLDGSSLALAAGGLSVAADGVDPTKLSFEYREEIILSASFSFSATRSTFTVPAAALTDTELVEGFKLFKSGVLDQTRVTTTAASNEWSISGTTLSVHDDITANGDEYRLFYNIASV